MVTFWQRVALFQQMVIAFPANNPHFFSKVVTLLGMGRPARTLLVDQEFTPPNKSKFGNISLPIGQTETE
jgi:hypothetical protein